jgi:hypothetical protein
MKAPTPVAYYYSIFDSDLVPAHVKAVSFIAIGFKMFYFW